jgi:5,10-methylenetetrahydromethanopterin reductase
MVRLARERLGPADTGIVVGAVTVVDEDGPKARAASRRRVAMYLAVVGALDPVADLDPELTATISARVADGDEVGAATLIPDGVLDLFAFSGTPDQVAAQAEALYEAGALRIEFGSPHGLDERGGVELLARKVIPRLGR